MAPTRYNAVDALKFIMAFAVIGIHAVALNSTEFNDAVNYWFASAVPFYFVTSGFLLQNKISRSNPAIEKHVMLDYAKRIARMYCLWLLIYLPLTAYACFRYKLEAGQFIVDQIYHLLIFGATLYSWPIWYLYSTAIAVFAIALLHRCGGAN